MAQELRYDPSLDEAGAPAIGSAIKAMVSAFGMSSFFAPLRAQVKNALANGSDKDVWVTTEVPTVAGAKFTGEAMYAWRYNSVGINGAYADPNNWVNATQGFVPSGTPDGNGIGVIYVDPTKWTANNSGTSFTRGWPGETADGVATVGRMIVHELGHAVSDPSNEAFRDTFTTGALSGHTINYNEELAAFIENAYYVPWAKANGASDIFLTGGHAYPTAAGIGSSYGGSHGVKYFSDTGVPYMTVNRLTGDVSFSETFLPSYNSVTKTYHHSGHQELGTTYSRYITVEYSSYAGIVGRGSGGALNLDSFITTKIIPESAAKNPITDLTKVVTADLFLDGLATATYGDSGTDTGTSTVLHYANISDFASYASTGQTRLLTLGADRHFDMSGAPTGGTSSFINVAGPTEKGKSIAPEKIGIDDYAVSYYYEYDGQGYAYNYPQYADTVIIGASGIDRSGDDPLDTMLSYDHIVAGQGHDILIGGDNTGPNPNILEGREGNDYIVAGTGKDILKGGAGYDVFVMEGGPGSTGGNVDGGAGLDTISFLETGAVTFNGFAGTAQHDGRTDQVNSVGIVVGSNGADDLSGGMMALLGAGGDDTIHLSSGTIAMGGTGNDKFMIDLNQSGVMNFMILDFEDGDSIYIDEQRHYGSTITRTQVGNDQQITYTSNGTPNPYATSYLQSAGLSGDYWTEQLLYDGNGVSDKFSVIQIKHFVGGTLETTANIFMTAFSPGEGGLAFNEHSSNYYGLTQAAGYFDLPII